MTGNNNNKFIPNTPKTYEVRYVENQEQQGLAKITTYLGVSQIYCNPQDNGGNGGSGAGGGSGSSGGSSAHTVHVDVSKAASNYASTQSYQLRREGRGDGCTML
jgi:hypothetical protein